jgi:hypothetical protein
VSRNGLWNVRFRETLFLSPHPVQTTESLIFCHFYRIWTICKRKNIKHNFDNLTNFRPVISISIHQWETRHQVANSINNLPLGLGNKTERFETLDLLTSNRLLLDHNNSRSPTEPLVLTRTSRTSLWTILEYLVPGSRSGWLTKFPTWLSNLSVCYRA